ncbi:30S ribosomal protein S20 [Hibiscus syriacus]|uniref:30S ribosomal protein S20 n=1 Tax=Hibiscus syriacus TaxID=106335 RepID=A0A6A2ZK51_HIBSY|nr:30S ribosomal protein S20 [Hibiscus syriacus]
MVVTHHRARHGLPSGVLESLTTRWRSKISIGSDWLVHLAMEASVETAAGSSWIRRRLGARKTEAEAEEIFPIEKLIAEAYSVIDKAVKVGTLHRNTGARRKSRLAQRKKAVAIQ